MRGVTASNVITIPNFFSFTCESVCVYVLRELNEAGAVSSLQIQ